MYDFNELQTELTDEYLKTLPKELISELNICLEDIPFIKNLVSPNRRSAKEMPKDENGKLIVDLTNPHKLENMDYFREAAIHYQKYGCYTFLYPNRNPNSDYAQFWKEETKKCHEGMMRPDGEWITGLHYWYLNYFPILRDVVEEGSRKSTRKIEFADVYDGDYLYFHYLDQCRNSGLHAFVLKKRGAGFSFKAAAVLAKLFILGESFENPTNVKGFAIANEKEYLVKDGVLNKFVDGVDWVGDNTPWPRIRNLKDSLQSMHWQMGYLDKEQTGARGTRNEIIGVTIKDDPDKARGKRGVFIFWEEVGKLPVILKAWTVSYPSVESGDYASGTMVGYGTGGTKEADFSGAQTMIYNPIGWHIKPLDNVYDRNSAQSQICFFFPEYLNRLGAYDENGNSDVIRALVSTLKEWYIIKYSASDHNAVLQYRAEHPITPQDAIMRQEGSIFPVQDIKDYLAEIIPHKSKFISPHYIGRLKMDSSGKVDWNISEDHPVLRDYPADPREDRHGAVEIFTLPRRETTQDIPWGRYIAGVDPIDSDVGVYTESLGSIFIMDLWTDLIVAEYTGRPQTANEFYEICLRFAKYYNAELNYENNLKGLFSYFDRMNSLHYLCDTPEVLKDRDLVKGPMFGNRAKGTPANKAVNNWARRLQADWMIENFVVNEGEEEEEPIEKLKLHTIRSIGYLNEALKWNPDDNFDRISAMGMLMILREDRLKYTEKRKKEVQEVLFNDSFFKRHGFGPSKKKMEVTESGKGFKYAIPHRKFL